MRIFHGFENLRGEITNPVCTLGSYDGIHLGHKELLMEVMSQARECHGESVVLTFEPHPRIALGKADGMMLITTLREKVELLQEIGIDNLVIISFDEEFSRVAYRDFVENYLVKRLSIKRFVMGYNHRLGRGSQGNYSTLIELGGVYGFEVTQVKELRESGDKVSSTAVRNHIMNGEISRATRALGRPYMIIGEVDSCGDVVLDSPIKLLPPHGVYTATVNGVAAKIEITTSRQIGVNGYCPQQCGEQVKIELSTDSKI